MLLRGCCLFVILAIAGCGGTPRPLQPSAKRPDAPIRTAPPAPSDGSCAGVAAAIMSLFRSSLERELRGRQFRSWRRACLVSH